MERIYLCLAHMSGNEMKYIQEAFDTNWVVPLGPNVNAFETELEQFVGCGKKVAALSAGTAAIHLSLVALNVGPGDEVICQSFTFAASCNPIVYLGATPVFIDSEEDTWNMDPLLLEEAINDRIVKTGKKPKAIIPAYLYGMPAKIDEIKGKTCGTFGEYGIMSFNGNKMITTSGGGAIICPNEETKKRILYFATQARQPAPYYLHTEIGYNYRMSNICAGIGRGQMAIANEHIRHHKKLCKIYTELFTGVEGINVHKNPSEIFDSNYWLNTITIDPQKTGTNYETIRQHLENKNVESRPLWKPMHTQPVYKDAPNYTNGVSESLFEKGLCLPSGPYVTEMDCRYIADEIISCLN